MKKYLISIASFALLLVGLVSIPQVKSAVLFYLPSSTSLTTVASTTASFVRGGVATTTKTVSTDGIEKISWLVALGSSTTPPTICWTNQYSNNGTDWYTEDSYNKASSTPSHLAAEKQECFTYATTSATQIISHGTDNKTLYIGRKIEVVDLDTAFTRTIFSVNAGVDAMLDIQSSQKNEVVHVK